MPKAVSPSRHLLIQCLKHQVTTEQFHDLVGVSNDEPDGPRNCMPVVHQADGVEPVFVDGGDGGLGDVRLGAAYRLWESASSTDVISVHGGVKLPTRDADDLTGSEATDVYAAVAWPDFGLQLERHLRL